MTAIPELAAISTTPFQIGAGVSLTDFISILELKYETDFNIQYGYQMAQHIKKVFSSFPPTCWRILLLRPLITLFQVANTNVRNVGSIAGNLMLKHAHNDFPSDIFNLLEAIGARLFVRETASGLLSEYSPYEWLSEDMDRRVLQHISMPNQGIQEKFM